MSLEDSEIVNLLNKKIEDLEKEVAKLKSNIDSASLCFNPEQENTCPFRARPLKDRAA